MYIHSLYKLFELFLCIFHSFSFIFKKVCILRLLLSLLLSLYKFIDLLDFFCFALTKMWQYDTVRYDAMYCDAVAHHTMLYYPLLFLFLFLFHFPRRSSISYFVLIIKKRYTEFLHQVRFEAFTGPWILLLLLLLLLLPLYSPLCYPALHLPSPSHFPSPSLYRNPYHSLYPFL